MLELGPIGVLNPLYLFGFLVLPILWWLLRAMPPRPRREAFPGVRILLSVQNRETTPHRTPLWLLILRMLVAALLLAAFAQPLLNPTTRSAQTGPLLLLFDGGWPSASDWSARKTAALAVLEHAREQNRPVAVYTLSTGKLPPEELSFTDASRAAESVHGMTPAAWRPDFSYLDTALSKVIELETVWLRDGLSGHRMARGEDPAAALAKLLASKGMLTLRMPVTTGLAMMQPVSTSEGLHLRIRRAMSGAEQTATVDALGAPRLAETSERGEATATAVGSRDRKMATTPVVFAQGQSEAQKALNLPLELRNALTRVQFAGARSAGEVAILDDQARRKRVAIIAGASAESRDQPLLDGTHYLKSALSGVAAPRILSLRAALGLPDGTNSANMALNELENQVETTPHALYDTIILADIGVLDVDTEAALSEWVENGGLLIRFAGPRLAAAAQERVQLARHFGSDVDLPLSPVRLRGGGRDLGGALSWSQPQRLAPFPSHSPFFGLTPPEEVTVSRQVLADPEPGLSQKVWAALKDGTPLVTSNTLGAGRLVLFHVTANADWSTLPLSGLFVEMLSRLTAYASSNAGSFAATADSSGVWTAAALVAGSGEIVKADIAVSPISGEELALAKRFGASATVPPGIYTRNIPDGGTVAVAVSAFGSEEVFKPAAPPPIGARTQPISRIVEVPLKPIFLAIAFSLLALDVLAALFAAGRLGRRVALATIAVAFFAPIAPPAHAQEETAVDPASQNAALQTIIAHVRTGDPAVDRITSQGLSSLSAMLYNRTAIEPGEPAAVDLDTDDIAFYSIIYWPITATQTELSPEAVRRMNQFLRTGGFLIVDTRDAHISGGVGGRMNAHLRRLLGPLDIPALEPMDASHLMNRTFYLVDGAPGRWRNTQVWVQAGTGGDNLSRSSLQSGALLNDGVSSVLIGGADWVGAWALDNGGRGFLPMGSGRETDRERAFRFGINLAIYAYTGSYKSDQVHIQQLLNQLGN
jgi:hypothetical protein